jgi:hypothetical protein
MSGWRSASLDIQGRGGPEQTQQVSDNALDLMERLRFVIETFFEVVKEPSLSLLGQVAQVNQLGSSAQVAQPYCARRAHQYTLFDFNIFQAHLVTHQP